LVKGALNVAFRTGIRSWFKKDINDLVGLFHTKIVALPGPRVLVVYFLNLSALVFGMVIALITPVLSCICTIAAMNSSRPDIKFEKAKTMWTKVFLG